MPLVRIDVQEGRTPEQVRRIADTVQDVLLDVFAAPARDQQGRTRSQKQAAYRELADRLHRECGLSPADLIVRSARTSPRTGPSAWAAPSS